MCLVYLPVCLYIWNGEKNKYCKNIAVIKYFYVFKFILFLFDDCDLQSRIRWQTVSFLNIKGNATSLMPGINRGLGCWALMSLNLSNRSSVGFNHQWQSLLATVSFKILDWNQEFDLKWMELERKTCIGTGMESS